MKKFFTIVLVLLALLVSTMGIMFGLIKSGAWQPINLVISKIDIRIDKGILDMLFYTNLDNPRTYLFNPYELKYQVYFDTTQIATGERTLIPCDTCTNATNDTFQLPLKLDMKTVQAKLKGTNQPDSTDLNIKMQVYFDFFGFGITRFPISVERTIKTPQPPTFELGEVTRDMIRLDTAVLTVTGKIINKNSFSIQLVNTRLNIDFEGLFDADLILQDTFDLQAKAESPFTATATVNDLQLVRDAFKILFTKKDHPFVLNGYTEMQLDSATAPIEVNIYSAGKAPLKPWKRDRK